MEETPKRDKKDIESRIRTKKENYPIFNHSPGLVLRILFKVQNINLY